MGLADRLEAARSRLSREGWATVLVLAGASLLVSPPTAGGLALLGHVAAVLVAAFVVVIVGARVLAVARSWSLAPTDAPATQAAGAPQRLSPGVAKPSGMVEAWIQLRCPNCGHAWESSPTDLPAPQAEFHCPSCGETRSTAQFMKDQRDLEILKEFAG